MSARAWSLRARLAVPVLAAGLALLVSAAPTLGFGTQPPAQADPEVAVNVASQISDEELERLLNERPVERVSVELVLLHVTVSDKRGRVVRELEPDDFSVAEDGADQPITVFGETFVNPLQLAVLLDLSGSMRHGRKLERAILAIRHLAASLRPRDAFALLAFADGQVAELVRWDEDGRRLEAVLGVLEAYGRTALTDAVAATPQLLDERALGKKAIVLFTDGVDNASRLNRWDAISAARRTGVPIYPVALVDRPKEVALASRYSSGNNIATMKRYAAETGGRLFLVERGEGLGPVIAQIQDDLRGQYLIGYLSPGPPDGSYRRVAVKGRSKRWTLRHRRGYYASWDPLSR